MNLSVAIVGLPNVGKSTLFNALLKRQVALAANYPFATVEPNTGVVEVPDIRLDALAKVVEQTEGVNPPLKPATIEFVDIAGLVKGAAEGEGLGNKFLANIRETSLICHVLRAFEDDDVVLTGQLDPYEDLQTVRMELILKDMETVQKSQETRTKDQKEKKLKEIALAKLIQVFDRGQMANTTEFSDDELEVVVKPLHLLTMKPEIFVINVSEEQLVDGLKKDFHEKIHVPSDNVVYISAKIESELASLTQEDQEMYLSDLGLTMSGIEQMANVAYQKLNLASYLTAGTIEVRAWTIKKGMTAQEAAGVIHTDFSKKFIKANVITFDNFVQFDGWKKAREVGKVRLEGKEYVVQDGDVIEFAIGS